MIVIIAIIYIFLSYVIFNQQLKITFRKSSSPLTENVQSPFFTHPTSSISPLKIQESASPALFDNIEHLSGLPLQKEVGGRYENLQALKYDLQSTNVLKFLWILQTFQKLLTSPTDFVKLFAASRDFIKVVYKSHKPFKGVDKFYKFHESCWQILLTLLSC